MKSKKVECSDLKSVVARLDEEGRSISEGAHPLSNGSSRTLQKPATDSRGSSSQASQPLPSPAATLCSAPLPNIPCSTPNYPPPPRFLSASSSYRSQRTWKSSLRRLPDRNIFGRR